jgi:FAD/FMN-containing dehydrogenase
VGAEEAGELAAVVAGPVLIPGNDRYTSECATFNLANVPKPALVVGATNPSDVQAGVRFAGRRGLPVAVKATGHQLAVASPDTVMITTGRMGQVVVDSARRRARVAAGARWGDVVKQTARSGLAPLNGSSPGVGVVGYTLGGGQSPTLGRSVGYAADHVHAIEVVTADGELRRVTAGSEPELFWAMRGGKGNFGVVTALEFGLFPADRFYGGCLFFSGRQLAGVLHGWREWVAGIPDQMTSSVGVQRLPALPALPEPLRGKFLVAVRIAYLGSAADGERMVAPLRACAPIVLDTVADRPYVDVPLIHMDPSDPVPFYDRTASLRELSPQTVDAIDALAGPDSDCPLLLVDIRGLGGALDREPEVPNAVPTRGVPFVVTGFGMGGPDQADRMRDYLDMMVSRLQPWTAPRRMPNFLSTDEATTTNELADVYGAERYGRLAAAKRRYDPQNMFRDSHNISPA